MELSNDYFYDKELEHLNLDMMTLQGKIRLYQELQRLVRSEVGKIVRKRMAEFRGLGKEGVIYFDFKPFLDVRYESNTFSELCFCILTANSTARLCIDIQRQFSDEGFSTLRFEEFVRGLKRAGHRFPRTRAKFIVEARRFQNVKEIVAKFDDVREAREWLVKNVGGIGWKEASHFLRNIGLENFAILDRHVLDVLREHNVISETPRMLTRKKYLEIESRLERIAEELGLSLGELDLYLWYMKTGKVLK